MLEYDALIIVLTYHISSIIILSLFEQHARIVALRLAAAGLHRALERRVRRRRARDDVAVLVLRVKVDHHAVGRT